MEKIQAVLLESHEKIVKAYQSYLNNPFDSDKSHKLRVSVRKFRALLNMLKPLVLAESYVRINQELRETAYVFEKVRELDVLTEWCGEFAMEHPDLSEDYARLFSFLQKERRKEMRRTLNKTNTQQVQNSLSDTYQFIDQLPENLVEESPTNEQEWSDYVTKRIKKKNQKMRKAFKRVNVSDHEAIHKVRLMAKKLRYAAKYLDGLTEIKTKSIVKRAKALQNELGERTDHQVNLSLLEEYALNADETAVQELLINIRDLS